MTDAYVRTGYRAFHMLSRIALTASVLLLSLILIDRLWASPLIQSSEVVLLVAGALVYGFHRVLAAFPPALDVEPRSIGTRALGGTVGTVVTIVSLAMVSEGPSSVMSQLLNEASWGGDDILVLVALMLAGFALIELVRSALNRVRAGGRRE